MPVFLFTQIWTLNFPFLQVRLNHSILLPRGNLSQFLGVSCSFPMTPKSLPPSNISSLLPKQYIQVLPTARFYPGCPAGTKNHTYQSNHAVFVSNLLPDCILHIATGTTTNPIQFQSRNLRHHSRLNLPLSPPF